MGHWALGMGHWAWGIGHGALGIGHWALVITPNLPTLVPALFTVQGSALIVDCSLSTIHYSVFPMANKYMNLHSDFRNTMKLC
ncbi:MAG: hypothetical protein VKL59_10855 [Nostocaceae cyanobacterium]|nr:hypothetical protein [Nostocaceae cyanobacterium]